MCDGERGKRVNWQRDREREREREIVRGRASVGREIALVQISGHLHQHIMEM
jgi:hypothetical protein